jgi:hypothetical protein
MPPLACPAMLGVEIGWFDWSIGPHRYFRIRICTSAVAAFGRANRPEHLPKMCLENAAGNVNCPGMNDGSGTCDVVVIGDLRPAAAVALAETGANTALVARRVPMRTIAPRRCWAAPSTCSNAGGGRAAGTRRRHCV